MPKFSQGYFQPSNPKKYVGNGYPIYRSSWEKRVFIWLDKHPSILKWASEPIKIPYQNPFNGKINNYIPDLMVEFVDNNSKHKVLLIEIKPITQSLEEYAKSKRDRLTLKLNQAKWDAASKWAKRNGVEFKVMTEKDIFGKPRIRGQKRKRK